MKTKFLILILMLTFNVDIFAQDSQILTPYGATESSELKSLQWNRYAVENFVVLSIDEAQGAWVSQNINYIEQWCLNRWGFPNFKHTKECRIFCVPNKALMKKLFNLDQSKIEFRKELTVMWIVMDDDPAVIFPKRITQIAFTEFENKNNVKIAWWFKRGAALLNATLPEIKIVLVDLNSSLKKDELIFVSEKIFAMTEADYVLQNDSDRKKFDMQAMALCLMLRKEFGEVKLQGFLRLNNSNQSQDLLKLIYGFNSFDHFDKQYVSYMHDLSSEVAINHTPNSYLEINSLYKN